MDPDGVPAGLLHAAAVNHLIGSRASFQREQRSDMSTGGLGATMISLIHALPPIVRVIRAG
jgi:hypothetical protein